MKIKIDTATASRLDIIGLNAMFEAMAKNFAAEPVAYCDKMAPVLEKAAHDMSKEAIKLHEQMSDIPARPIASVLSGSSLGVVKPRDAAVMRSYLDAVKDVPTPAERVAAPETSEAGQGEAVDENGLPWDERIHSGSRDKNVDGSWRRRRNVPDDVFGAVVAELKGETGIPVSEPETNPIAEILAENTMGTTEHETREAWEGAIAEVVEKVTEAVEERTGEPVIEPATVTVCSTGDRQSPSAFMLASDPMKVADPNDSDPMLRPADTEPEEDDDDGPKDLEDQLDDALNADRPTFTDEEANQPVDALTTFWNAVHEERTWDMIKRHLSSLMNSDQWKEMDGPTQNTVRASLWQTVENVGIDVVHTADPTAFSCWMQCQTQQEDADVVESDFNLLRTDDTFKALKPQQQERMKFNTAAHVAALRKGS